MSQKLVQDEYRKEQGTQMERGIDKKKLFINEIQSVSTEINTYESSKRECENVIKSIENSIKNATVKASLSGKINMMTDIVVGNHIGEGLNVMTILPQSGEQYNVTAYISNKDIARIKNGMKVAYEISSYPSSEYGNIKGEVMFVSTDTVANSNEINGYYKMKASLKAPEEKRNQINFKAGMLCKIKVVVEQKRLIFYLLEKIKLIG